MKQQILITAGGTGGHIFPALALAKLMQTAGYDVSWIGTPQGMEASLVPTAGIAFTSIAMKGLRGKSWLERLKTPGRSLKAMYASYKQLKRLKPVLVVAFGGYVTGPVGIAAFLCRIPLVLHEQNAYMGLSNRCLQWFASRICLAFPLAKVGPKMVITGNPVRAELLNMQRQMTTSGEPLHLLVLGGSQGAQAINTLVPEAIALMELSQRPLILHQAGKDKETQTSALYQKYQLSATVNTFIDDMMAAYQWADLVIARAGAMTVSELACVGLPSVLIPLPSAVDDHQTANAQYLAEQDASWLLPQRDAKASTLAAWLAEVDADRARLENMAKQACLAAKPLATEQLWQVCLGVIREKSSTYTVTKP